MTVTENDMNVDFILEERARELAGADDMIFIGGSTYVVGEAL